MAELRFGAERRHSKRLHRLIDGFCSGVTVLPFDEEAAARFGVVGARLAADGLPIGQLDTLIAAHAIAADLTLVTNNTKHFSRVQGLRSENWTRSR